METIRKGVVSPRLKDSYADETTAPFWDAALEGKLVMTKCTKCHTVVHPPGPRCFNCQNTTFKWVELPGTGTIYTFTVIHHGVRPAPRAGAPYVSGVIEVDGTQGAGARMICNVIDVDPAKVKIGDKVKVVFDKITDTF